MTFFECLEVVIVRIQQERKLKEGLTNLSLTVVPPYCEGVNIHFCSQNPVWLVLSNFKYCLSYKLFLIWFVVLIFRRKKKQHPGGDKTGLRQEELPKKKKLLTRTHKKKPWYMKAINGSSKLLCFYAQQARSSVYLKFEIIIIKRYLSLLSRRGTTSSSVLFLKK